MDLSEILKLHDYVLQGHPDGSVSVVCQTCTTAVYTNSWYFPRMDQVLLAINDHSHSE